MYCYKKKDFNNFRVGMHREAPSFSKGILEQIPQNSLAEVRISLFIQYYCAYKKSDYPAMLSFWKKERTHGSELFLFIQLSNLTLLMG